MSTIRTFIALPVSSDVQRWISGVQSDLRNTQAQVKWETESQFHITLKFLGDIDSSLVEPISDALQQSFVQFHQFDLMFQRLGAFPDSFNPKIIWIGIQSHSALISLQHTIEQTCETFGIPKESRSFHPHITLGRVKGLKNIHRLTDAIKTGIFEPMQVHCHEIELMKSDLSPDGATYTKLKSFPLHT
ncbi:MAG TPA: RNA 2',3'-cyclic phosphodiesterase [Bacteroidota bacterium]|nr:RNA 2',3'-cyclic phosphodiesterase [Bacteroidota bacterium]